MNRYQSLFRIGLVLPNDLIAHFLPGIGIRYMYDRAKEHTPVAGERTYIDHLGICKFVFNLGNAPFDKTLLLPGRMVFGVFPQIAMRSGLRDCRDYLGAHLGLENTQFLSQRFRAASCHWCLAHYTRIMR